MAMIAQKRKIIKARPFAIQSLLDKFFFISSNAKGEAAGTHPEDEAGLFTLASTRLFSESFLISNLSQFSY